MGTDDPFSNPIDDRTVIRPNPGLRRASVERRQERPVSAPGGRAEPELLGLLSDASINPLVAAASTLLGLISHLRASTAQGDPEFLRDRVVEELKQFEAKAEQTGQSRETLRAAHYALCATIDDLVLNTPWGSGSSWHKQSMTSSFHQEVTGGERFFEILTQLHKNPGRSPELLELMYLCLSLGFEGRFRVAPRGSSELARIRDGVYRTIREIRGEFERSLSPHWRGVETVRRTIAQYVPGWVYPAVAAVLLTGIFMAFSYRLNETSDRTFESLATLPPQGPVAVARAATTVPPPVPNARLPRLRQFLAPEIAAGLVEVAEDAQRILVRIRSSGMFPSGSAGVAPKFIPLLQRIGQALKQEPGSVIVAGYTDNVPIRTLQFPSNWHLSLARARAVNAIVAPLVGDVSRIKAEGRGEADPLAPNDKAEGRERNRRIEIVVAKPQ